MEVTGPNGLPVRFYLDHWSYIKIEVIILVKGMATGNLDLHAFNYIDIVLILKGSDKKISC